MPRFSPWCQMCLDGDPRPDAHQRHVLQLKRERAKRPSKLRWQLEKIEPPAPGKTAQGEHLAAAGYVDQQQKPSESVSGQAAHAQDDQFG